VNSRFKKDLNLQIHQHIVPKLIMIRFKKGKMEFLKSRFACTALAEKRIAQTNVPYDVDLIRMLTPHRTEQK
jgi:hypothetical protein